MKLITVNERYYRVIPVTEYMLEADVPKPLTLLFVSDLHEYHPGTVMRSIKSYDGRSKVDAVLVGGDYFHDSESTRNGEAFLRECAAAFPTFCASGNHEVARTENYRGLVLSTGARLLENDSVSFEGIFIGGIEGKHRPDRRWLESFCSLDGYKLLLSHHPEFYKKYISPLPVDLVLSGHAHGGQWRLLGRGIYAPGQGLFPRYSGGVYDGGRLIVSRGIGNLSRVPRINNGPEIVAVRLMKNN